MLVDAFSHTLLVFGFILYFYGEKEMNLLELYSRPVGFYGSSFSPMGLFGSKSLASFVPKYHPGGKTRASTALNYY